MIFNSKVNVMGWKEGFYEFQLNSQIDTSHHEFLASHFKVWGDQLFDGHHVPGFRDQGINFVAFK